MDAESIVAVLNNGSLALHELTQDIETTSGFLDLIATVDDLGETEARFYEQGPSLYQSIAKGKAVHELEHMLGTYFGPPSKPAGQPLPMALRFNNSAKHLGGIQKEQSLFIKKTAIGEFYGALWPWQRKKKVTTIHLGFCSDKITDDDYSLLEELVKKARALSLSQRVDDSPEGVVRGVSLTSFLQMAEMEASSCTLRVTSNGRVGLLYLHEGKLLDAKTEALRDREAAYRIISWQNTEIEILPAADKTEDTIKQPLMHVLMQSLKVKDEADTAPTQTLPEEEEITLEMEGQSQEAREVPTLVAEPPPAKEHKPPPSAPKGDAPPGLVPKPDIKATALSKARSDKRVLVVAVAAVLVVVAVAGLIALRSVQANRIKKEYTQLIEEVAKTEQLEEKEILLADFIDSHDASDYTLDAEKRLVEIAALIEERDFEETSREINDLPVDHRYEAGALALFNDFKARYPDTERGAELKQMIDEIAVMVDDMAYESLTSIPPDDLDARLTACSDYLNNFPNGKYRAQVTQLTSGLSVKAFRDLKANVKKLEKKRQYDEAIDICRRYQSLFPDSRRLPDVRLIQAGLEDKQDLTELQRLSENQGSDYEAARQLFIDYLDKNPQTSQVQNIEKEIALFDQKIRSRREWQKMVAYSRNPNYKASDRIRRMQRFIQKNPGSPFIKEANQIVAQLETEAREEAQRSRAAAEQQQARARAQQAEAQRRQELLRQQQAAEKVMAQLKATRGRYVAAGKEIIRDTQTGLMWATLDSHLELGRCVSYDRAMQYVRALRNGGYADWRLPTSAELAGIYKNYPFFPDSGAKWYWTSETYVKGYRQIANIVTTKRESVFKREYFELDQCGAVRAVRP